MKLGYSLLLGEYIQAESIDYNDCRAFQVVCPACKEPVFKVTRETNYKPVGYLSHYKTDHTYLSDCELRVESISNSSITATNSESRDQFLKYFQAVLRETIIKSEYVDASPGKRNTKAFLNSLETSKGLAELRDLLYGYCSGQFKDVSNEELYELFDSYIEDISMDGGECFKTQFSIDTQKRIAADTWRHLLAAKSKANYEFVFNHGFAALLSRIEGAMEVRDIDDWEKYMYVHMTKFIKANKNKAHKIMDQLKSYPLGPPHILFPASVFVKLAAEITHEMVGCLLRLPYFDMLKNQKTGGNG